MLREKFKENRTAHGAALNGAAVSLYIGDESWTVTMRPKDAPSMLCMVTKGTLWQRAGET